MHQGLDSTDRKILEVIRSATAARVAPTYREIAKAVGLKSPNSVFKRLQALAAKGLVRLPAGKARGIELTNYSRPVPVPLLGEVRAGPRQLLDQGGLPEDEIEQRHLLPGNFVGTGTLFMLRVRGNSMIEAGILEGDHVVVRQQQSAASGDLVAAIIPPDGVTIRFWRTEDRRAQLVGADAAHTPIDAAEALILGKIVTILRRV